MTTAERVAAAAFDPSELVDGRLFAKLSAYAECVVGPALMWLHAVAYNPGVRPHYTAFCGETLGFYLHHVPPAPGVAMSEDEIGQTLPALRATGYRVDVEYWAGYPCCPPNPCVVKAQRA